MTRSNVEKYRSAKIDFGAYCITIPCGTFYGPNRHSVQLNKNLNLNHKSRYNECPC